MLLIDEDTSATNFMIRDHRMQELVSKDREPITPFIDMVRSLDTVPRVSTVVGDVEARGTLRRGGTTLYA